LSPAEQDSVRTSFQTRWLVRQQTTFVHLKQALITAPVLVLPDFEKRFELVADACQVPPAVGAVLLQEGRPVTYYSRKLSDAELNYSPSDIEMLAVIASLTEWRCYLEGAEFTIVTDHQPNAYLDVATNAHTIKRRARWLSISCGYQYKWCYRPGRINVADPISRAPQHFDYLCSIAAKHHIVGTWQRQLSLTWKGQKFTSSCGQYDMPETAADVNKYVSCCHTCCTVTRRSSRLQHRQRDAVAPTVPRQEPSSNSCVGGSDTPLCGGE
jgi:hypothetical protein